MSLTYNPEDYSPMFQGFLKGISSGDWPSKPKGIHQPYCTDQDEQGIHYGGSNTF